MNHSTLVHHSKEAYAVFYCITYLEYLLRDRKFCLVSDYANLVYINKSVNMMVQWWKTVLGSNDFVIEDISGVKNILAGYLSRLVKTHDHRDQEVLTEGKNDELIVLTLHHETKIPHEAYVNVKSIHNDIVGLGGVETIMSKLAKGCTPWKYMRLHVLQLIHLCATCQKMSNNKLTTFTDGRTKFVFVGYIRWLWLHTSHYSHIF